MAGSGDDSPGRYGEGTQMRGVQQDQRETDTWPLRRELRTREPGPRLARPAAGAAEPAAEQRAAVLVRVGDQLAHCDPARHHAAGHPVDRVWLLVPVCRGRDVVPPSAGPVGGGHGEIDVL